MNKYLVEFLGTLFLMYIILAVRNPLAIGSALAIAIILGGHVSGGHFNPVVTGVMLMNKKLEPIHTLPYFLAQAAGGLLALQIYKQSF